jgi:type IV pilus assembly protein PilW
LPAGTNGLENKVVPGSDVLVVSLTGPATPLVDPFTNGAAFKTQTPHDLKQYEVAVVSNCQQAEIFQITNLNDSGATVVGSAATSITPGNSGPISNTGPTRDFRAGTEISALRTYVYYVGRSDYPPNRPSLFRAGLAVTASGSNYILEAEEIINGVDSLQVTYGLDTNGDFIVDSYVAAGAGVDWTQVRAVRVALLARSPEEFLPTADTATYRLAGTTVDPVNDRRQRRVFQTTIALRNRLL